MARTPVSKAWLDQQRSLYIAVAGIQAGGRDISRCRAGDSVRLVPEPTNKFDPHAVRVETPEGKMLGYVPATYAAVMAAGDWAARIEAVLPHPKKHTPAGLRLRLDRKESQ